MRKFSTQMQVSLQQQPTQVSLSSLDVNTNNETITMATTVGGGGVNETTIMATSSSENKPLLLNWLDNAAAQLSKTTRQSRFTATTAVSGSTNSASSSTTSAGNSNSTKLVRAMIWLSVSVKIKLLSTVFFIESLPVFILLDLYKLFSVKYKTMSLVLTNLLTRRFGGNLLITDKLVFYLFFIPTWIIV